MSYLRRLVLDAELLPSARLVGVHLREEPDPQATAKIAEALGISESTALRAVKTLEQHGWARRVHSLWASAEGPLEDRC